MKKKGLVLGLLAVSASLAMLGFAACGDGGNQSSGGEHTEHTYVNGVCECGETQLTYTLSGDGSYYMVSAANKEGITGAVVIPDEYEGKPVKEIQAQAFHSTKITQLQIGNNVEIIRQHAIQLCEKMESVTLGDSVETIEQGAFYDCTALQAIEFPASVKNIGSYVFTGCKSLKSVTIPATVETVGKQPFGGCEGLESVTLEGKDTVYEVTQHAKDYGSTFAALPNLKSVTVKEGVESIVAGMFLGCPKLDTVSLPESLKTIGAGAFADCSALESIDIQNLEAIEEDVFKGCSSLQEIEMQYVNTIGYGAFTGCGFTQFVISDTVKTLGEYAFKNCKNLTEVKIGSGLTSLPQYAFAGTALQSCVIPENVTDVQEKLFIETPLEWVVVPKNIEYIGFNLFHSSICPNLTAIYYTGTPTQWNNVRKHANWNSGSKDTLKVYCYAATAEDRVVIGGSWHYVNGVPTVW